MTNCESCGRDTTGIHCSHCIGHFRKDDQIGRSQLSSLSAGGNAFEGESSELPFGYHYVSRKPKFTQRKDTGES